MVTFEVHYADGNVIEHGHITEAVYVVDKKTINVPEAELSHHLFPIGHALWLKSSSGVAVLSGVDMREIIVTAE